MSMATRDQEYMDRTEVEVALDYAEMAAEYEIPVTLFLTGRSAIEEPNRVKQLAAMQNVEIGGHNYWAFDTLVHKTWRAVEKLTHGLIGSWNGPRPFQRYEIRKTIATLNTCGADVTVWRDHAYRHDKHTAGLLADEEITHFSDAIGPNERVEQADGVTVVPVNTPPDHEHVFHAFRTPGSEAVEQFFGPFGGNSVSVDEWVTWVLDRIETVCSDDQVATVLAHPACLFLSDELVAFERLLQAIDNSGAPTVQMSEINGDDP
jgi:hypothetical protein